MHSYKAILSAANCVLTHVKLAFSVLVEAPYLIIWPMFEVVRKTSIVGLTKARMAGHTKTFYHSLRKAKTVRSRTLLITHATQIIMDMMDRCIRPCANLSMKWHRHLSQRWVILVFIPSQNCPI